LQYAACDLQFRLTLQSLDTNILCIVVGLNRLADDIHVLCSSDVLKSSAETSTGNSMLPLKALKNMKAYEAMLAEIEAELLVKLTQAVRQRNFQEQAYTVLICYVDLTPERWIPTYPTVLWEKDRENRRGSDLWSLPDLPDPFQCAMPESETLERRCSLVYDFLTQEGLDQPEKELILPFRKMV
jgi:hypothetical protein